MKNFKLFKLLLLGVVLITTVPQAKAWWQLYWNGDFTCGCWDQKEYIIQYALGGGGDGQAHRFLPIYTPARTDAHWKLYCEKDDGSCYSLAPLTEHYSLNADGTKYQVKGDHPTYSFETDVNAGVISVHTHQSMTKNDATGDVDGSNDKPAVWLERPTIHIWHNWSGNTSNWGDNNGSGQKDMTDNNDGTYIYDGVYSASGTNVGLIGSATIKKYFADNASTKVGSPVSGDKCRFTWNPGGNNDPYVGYEAETKHRGSLTITKILTITYDGNGKTGGSIPSSTDAVYNQASTLATNSNNLTKTNYHFNGWNTKADGKGTHYDAGGSITVTANTKLYAEWVDEWAIQGSGTEMGAWSAYKYLPYSGTANTFSGTIDLAANTTYVFKIRNRNTGKLWGYGDNDYQLAFVGQSSAYEWDIESTDGKKNLVLMTAKAGTYTFTWNSSTKRLTVGFPSQTHPNNNNIYFKNSGGSAYSTVNAHIWNGTASTGYYRLPTLPTCTFAGETYYYAAIGDNTKCLFADGEVNPSTKTSDQSSVNEKKGKYYDLASGTWKDFTVSVTLNNQSATTTGATSVIATYGSAMPSIAANRPTKYGYAFQGYYASTGGSGTKYYNADGTSAHAWDQTGASPEIYAYWTPVTLTFSTEGNWNDDSKWSPTCVPTIEHDVIITKPVTVNITTAKAKSVKIYNDGTNSHTGKLTIGAGNALVVANDIAKTKDGSTKIATTADVLHIEAGSTSAANGALVWGTSGTPGAAQVDFFTKSHGVKGDGTSINQYIGTPFSNDQSILYQYYYSWLFKIKRTDGVLSWDLMAGDESMNEFEGYNLITAYDANTTYQMEGILVSNANVTLSTSSATGLPNLVYTTGNASNPNNENVLANSWVAPIRIAALSGFSGVESTIYIFNAGSETQGSGGTGDTPGNYSTYSISGAGNAVIPSMQSFSVYTNGLSLSPSITLNYNTIVKSPLSSAYYNSANKAPARNRADEMQLLKVRIDCENGWADELKIYIHEDFTNAFEDSWDAHKMYGYQEAPQLYAVTTDGNMAINCVPTADNNVLGFTPGSEDNEYTFSFTYDGDEEYYLKDTKLNIETLINTEATYTFTSEDQDSDMRFIIIKRAPAVATDAETVSGDRLAVSGVQKIMHNGQLYIIRDGGIYSTDGQMVK